MRRLLFRAALAAAAIACLACGGAGKDGSYDNNAPTPSLGCTAKETPVVVSGGVKPLEELQLGDQVLVVSTISKNGDQLDLTWSAGPVVSSGGTSEGLNPAMVHLVYGDSAEIIVTTDHLFLLSNGQLIQASKLVPGDLLASPDGGSATVQTVSLGSFEGGVHQIAASGLSYPGNMEGHLINTHGLVSADFLLQIHYASHPGSQSVIE